MWRLLILCLLVMIPITLANPLDFEPNRNGYIDVVDYNGKVVYKLGFAITGKIDGVKVSTTSHGFDWVTSTQDYTYEKYIPQLINLNGTLENHSYYETKGARSFIAYTDSAFNWTIEIDNRYDDGNKITHKLDNNYRDIENATFYYVFEVSNFNVMANGIRIQDSYRLNNILGRSIRIGGYTLDFSDLMNNGFDIIDLYIGDGHIIGYPNNKIVALGVTKGNGDFNRGLSVTLDPTTTGYMDSGGSGDPYFNWTNYYFSYLSDNQYATSYVDWEYLSITNFSILESEGGSVPDNSIIQGIQWEVEAKGQPTLGGDYPQMFFMPTENKNDGHIDPLFNFSYWEVTSEGYYFLGGNDQFPNLNRWSTNSSSNENFQIVVSGQIPASAVLSVDSARVKYTYGDGIVNNVSKRRVSSEDWYFLPIPETSDDANLTHGNTVYYNSFDHFIPSPTGIYNFTSSFAPMDLDTTQQTVGNDWGVDGYIGEGIRLNGIKGAWIVPYGHSQSRGNYSNDFEYTIALWVRFDGGGNTQAILSKEGSFNPVLNMQYRLTRTPFGTIQIRNRINSSASNCVGGISVSNNVWTHIVTTWNGTERVIYTNGILDAYCSLSGYLVGFANELKIGDSYVSTIPALNGTIDEFIFMDYALSEEQAKGLFANSTKKVNHQGYYDIEDLNIGENTDLNLSILSKQYRGSNVTVQLGNLSGGSYTYGDPIDIYGNDTISSSILDGENFSIRLNLYAGTNDFISPIVYNYTAVGFNTTTAVTCSYSCSGQIIALPLDCLGQDLILDGLGTIDFTDSVKADSTQVTGGCFASFFDSLEVLN